nr:ribosomal RNA processing protein 1 homolog B isoform X1 [Misgurnus anguillicaudatus]
MASKQEAEIIFAQKLASNEKPIRSKALLKLRKYISVRSEKEQGGFSEDELLKIWKGLFYCLWMQDLPLLQEELSTKISGLLHSFRTVDSQFLYFKTFLQTMKREWNGIDRLRMDKFYQCVRFVFREVFEMLKRQDWKPSVVNEFLELISGQLLQSSSSAPSGLILHILDLYLNELALIGSATLTAEQNLTFIEPFCKAMAKTKDRVLLKAIGSNVFNTIVDQVPFAIEDLLREIRQNEGRESESEDEEAGENQMKMKAAEDDDHEEDDSDLGDDFSYEKDVKDGAECGPVLQFDYGAIADRLFQLASYTNIPSFNRSKIYKFVKIFRDLSEGVFPQDEVEVVSSDEDDEDDNRRRRKKKKRLNKQSQEKTDKADTESSEITPESVPSKEKKKKGKKRRLKGIEDQTGSDVDRPMIETVDVPASKPLNTNKKKKAKGLEVSEEQSKCMISISDPPKEQQDTSDLRPVKKQKKKKKESEREADEELSDLSVVPPALQKKKRKLKKKTRCAADGETTGDCSQTDDKQTENCCAEMHTNTTAPDLSTVTTTLKKKKTKKTSTDDPTDVKEEKTENKMKVKKSKIKKKAVRSEECGESDETAETLHIDEKQTQSHENTETNTVNKKKKKKLKSMELNGETNESVKRKRNLMNGHAEPDSVKKLKIFNESDKPTNQMNTKGFAFSPKKSPTALFCRSAGFITPVCKKQSLKISKSETKKVTFGLKNNKTMEFRKMDRSSLLSPAGQSQVAFDPKKTPKSGVLKSPTSSPAIRRRSTAADFF